MKAKVIAYYLPQFHPTKENDEWWGKGFTEWTNVAKAKPLFRGHEQPHVPSELGFYDLRLPEARIAQADLAQEYGVSAFCYWHYWFAGKKILNTPFEEVVRTKEPKIPFCLAWANHSWYNKLWSSSTSGYVSLSKSKLLIEQTYPGVKDHMEHFYDLLDAFKDPRYYKLHGRLVFVIFDPSDFPDFNAFKSLWNELADKEGVPHFYFIAHVLKKNADLEQLMTEGYDAVNLSLHREPFETDKHGAFITRLKAHFTTGPERVDYKDAIKAMDSALYSSPNIIPTIIPNWDHTPRSGRFGRLFTNVTPVLFEKHVKQVLNRISGKDDEDKVVFLKSWNEWGEGNYIEPDLQNGRSFLAALKNAIK